MVQGRVGVVQNNQDKFIGRGKGVKTMVHMTFVEMITDQTNRALWSVSNVIESIPDSIWNKSYCEMPLWKHVYHMLHSLDMWFINPRTFSEPRFHEKDLNSLNVSSERELTKIELKAYFLEVEAKIKKYLLDITDDELAEKPNGCEYSRLILILAQHRHLHSHMGMIMGFVIVDTGQWPRVLGIADEFPIEGYQLYY